MKQIHINALCTEFISNFNTLINKTYNDFPYTYGYNKNKNLNYHLISINQ